MQGPTTADTLAKICDQIEFDNGSGPVVCQGFVYHSYNQVAFFKGQAAKTVIDQSKLCYSPNTTLWLLNAGGQDTKQLFQMHHCYAHLHLCYATKHASKVLHLIVSADCLTVRLCFTCVVHSIAVLCILLVALLVTSVCTDLVLYVLITCKVRQEAEIGFVLLQPQQEMGNWTPDLSHPPAPQQQKEEV